MRPRSTRTPLLLLTCCCLGATPAAAQLQFGQPPGVTSAARHAFLVAQAPSAFARVPASVRDRLESTGCRIPQPPAALEGDQDTQRRQLLASRANLVRGEFFEAGHQAWAAVCSRDGLTSILFLHEEEAWEPVEFRAMADAKWLGEVEQHFYFTTRIERVRVDSSSLRQAFPELTLEEQRRRPHDALMLHEVLGGTGQPVYWTGRRWVALPGYH